MEENAEICLTLTDDSSDIVPHRQAVSLCLLPLVVVAQVVRKPEEEGVVDQLQTRISQGILQNKQSRNVFALFNLCLFKSAFVLTCWGSGLTGSTPGRQKAWQKPMA